MINDIKKYNDGIEKVLSVHDFSILKNKSILITGINGLICSALVDVINYLNEYKGYSIKVIGTVRNKNKLLSRFKKYKNLEIVEQDVTDKIEISYNVDYIIHGASNSHPERFRNDPIGTMDANFNGTKNLLDFGLKSKIKRFLFISSGEIYGQANEDVSSFAEDYSGFIDTTKARSCYPVSKLAAESLCSSYHEYYGIDTVIVRPCHIYGPTMQDSDSRAFAQFIKNALNEENIVMKSAGKQIRSYCYVLDCVTGILCSLVYGKSGEVYNIANNNSISSIKDMALIIAQTLHVKLLYDMPTESEMKSYNPVTKSVLNGLKLEKIGWKPQYTFKNGLFETIEIMKTR